MKYVDKVNTIARCWIYTCKNIVDSGCQLVVQARLPKLAAFT